MALISITGTLVNPFGSGISGAYVYFTSNDNTDGTPTVPKTADAYFVTDESGRYSSQLMSPGWFKVDLRRPDWLEPKRLGVGILDGTETSPIDLSDLLYTSLPLPMKLANIADINIADRENGSFLSWDNATQKWVAEVTTGQFTTLTFNAATSGVLASLNAATSGVLATLTAATGSAAVSLNAATSGALATLNTATSGALASLNAVTSGALNMTISGKTEMLYQSFTQSGTVGASSDLMYTSIPANTMSANGDRLRAAGVFSTVSSGEKNIKAYFGSTLIADVSHYNFATPARPVHVFGEVIITRTAAATQNVHSKFWDETHFVSGSTSTIEFAPPPVYNVSAFTGVSLNLANANTFKFTASGAGTNDIIQKEMLIEYLPAP